MDRDREVVVRHHQTRNAQWILAFDGSCGRCRRISEVVEEASRGRLEVRPLADPDVRRWREQALGAAAPWKPTVIRVRDGRVRAWTGPQLGARLAVRLGPGHTIRVLRALGELSTESSRPPQSASARPDIQPDGVGRRGLLKLGAGVGVGLGLMFSGTAPAFAAEDPRKLEAARAWARANQTPRPGQYDQLAKFELAHRKVAFGDLAPEVRSALWREQFARFRADHPELTAEQVRLLDEADTLIAEPTLFADPGPELRQRVKDFESAAIDVFGRGRACGLFSTLGPTGTAEASTSEPRQGCSCSIGSECNYGCNSLCSCAPTSTGCGCFYVWACDGTYCG